MKRCYTCGYEERILSRVVYCVHCEETMVHRYCMDPPRHGDEEFDWVCEICCPREYKHSKSRRTSEYLCSTLDSKAEKRNPRRRLKKLGDKSRDHQEDTKKSVGSVEEFVADEYVCSKLDSEAEKRNPRRRLKKLGDMSHDHQEDSKKSFGSLEEFAAELEPEDFYDDQPIGGEEVSVGFTGTRPVEELHLHSPSNDFGEMQCDLKGKESLPGANRTTQKEGSADLEQVSRASDRSRCSSQTSNETHEVRGQSLKEDQDPTKCPPLQEPETDLRCSSYCSPRSENLSSSLPSASCFHKQSSSLVHNDVNSHPTEEKGPSTGVNEGSAAHQPTLDVRRYQLIPRVGDGSHKSVESFLPISDVSWSGTCRVTDKMHGMSVKLEAHLSNAANFKVSDAARTLPLPLDLELVDKCSEWPERFSEEPPCGNDIGLYFFPSQSSDRKAYDELLGKMIIDDLSLRFTRSDVRLLVFSSLELPKGAQRFDGKLYLWGAFSAPLSLPSGEKVSIHRPPVPSHSKGGSCLEEDLASDRRSCRPAGGEVQSIQKGQGSSDTIQPTQQNAHSNDQRDSGRPSSLPSRPVWEMETRHESTLSVQNSPHSPQPTWKSLKPASTPDQADPRKHDHAAIGKRDSLQDPNVRSNPDTQIEGGRDSACIKKRKSGKAEFPDQRKLDAPGNPANNCKRMFSRPENGNFKQQFKQNFRSRGPKQKQKNKQKQKQKNKRWDSPYKKSPMDKAPKPGSRTQRSLNWHHEPHTTSSGAEHSVAMNDQSPQSNPHPHQVPSFSHHEMPINRNRSEHSHPQPCAGFLGWSHQQPCPSFPGGQHAMPVTGQSYPPQYAGFPGGQHTMPPGFPGGQHALPCSEQSHPQQYGGFSGGQHTMPVVGQWHPQPYAGVPGGQHGMPMTGQWHPQPYASFPSSQHPMWQPHPQPHANFPGGQQAMPVVGSIPRSHAQERISSCLWQ